MHKLIEKSQHMRFIYLVWRAFNRAGGITCCNSLSFTILLAFIPFSISIASLSSWLTVSPKLIHLVEFYFFNEYLPQSGSKIYDLFEISFQHSTQLSTLGLCSLVLTCYGMMFTLEQHIHQMWQTDKTRAWHHSIYLFTGFFIIGTIIVYTIASSTIYLDQYVHDILWRPIINRGSAIISTIISFIAVYKFIPSKKIAWKHAISVGLFASALFILLQTYFNLAMRYLQDSYLLLYGSLAILPVFMLWLYFSVMILLVGAQIIYILENHFA